VENALRMFMETRMEEVLNEVGRKPEIKKLDQEIDEFGISEKAQAAISHQACLFAEEAYKVGFKDALKIPTILNENNF